MKLYGNLSRLRLVLQQGYGLLLKHEKNVGNRPVFLGHDSAGYTLSHGEERSLPLYFLKNVGN